MGVYIYLYTVTSDFSVFGGGVTKGEGGGQKGVYGNEGWDIGT